MHALIITQDYHLSRVFGSGLYLPLCPAPGFPALYTAIYGLLFSLLAIAILLIYIIRYGIFLIISSQKHVASLERYAGLPMCFVFFHMKCRKHIMRRSGYEANIIIIATSL
jgi:hypothetical protein